MTPAEAWLRDRCGDAPPALLARMLAALPPEPAAPVPDALTGAAVALYRQVISAGGGREDALPLLAADALATHALEAQAAIDPDGVATLAARMLTALAAEPPTQETPWS